MNTDKMIPIDFSRNITPFVKGDTLLDIRDGSSFTFAIVTDDMASSFNNKNSHDKNFVVVSFASRPNTGTQPVADDVEVDIWYDDEMHLNQPPSAWDWDDEDIENWTINHAALLAKFKEQGANTMTKLAEQKRLAHAVALTIESLDNNPDKPNQEPESMIGSSEFYQSDNSQVIEPWVGDQLEDLINPVSEGCQADKPKLVMTEKARGSSYDRFIAVGWSDDLLIKHGFAKVDKPVFTQEMADAGELPPIGVKCEIKLRNNKQSSWEIGSIEVKKGEWVCIDRCESLGVYDLADLYFRPIDNRSDEDKLIDLLLEDYDISQGEAEALVTDTRFALTLNKE